MARRTRTNLFDGAISFSELDEMFTDAANEVEQRGSAEADAFPRLEAAYVERRSVLTAARIGADSL